MSLRFTFTHGRRINRSLLYTIDEKQIYKLKDKSAQRGDRYQCYINNCKVGVKVFGGVCSKIKNYHEHSHPDQEQEMKKMCELNALKLRIQNTTSQDGIVEWNEIDGSAETQSTYASTESLSHEQNTIQQLQQELKSLKEANNCIVCLDEPRTTIMLPCGHACLCNNCACIITLSTNKCPMCRKSVESTNPFYI